MAQANNSSVPELKHHKATGRAYVLLDKRRHYLGRFGTAEARYAFDQLIAEWLASGRRGPSTSTDLTVVELIAMYLAYVERHYKQPDGKRSFEFQQVRSVMKHVRDLYGREPATAFGPKALKAVRARMVNAGWARRQVNKQISRIRRMFKWSVAEEIIPVSVHEALKTVEGLQRTYRRTRVGTCASRPRRLR